MRQSTNLSVGHRGKDFFIRQESASGFASSGVVKELKLAQLGSAKSSLQEQQKLLILLMI